MGAGVDIIGAMILTAFVRPVTWFTWPALGVGSDPGGNTSGPVNLLLLQHECTCPDMTWACLLLLLVAGKVLTLAGKVLTLLCTQTSKSVYEAVV